MIRRGFVSALAVVVVANLAALIGVARNRSVSDAAVVLEERELELLPALRDTSRMRLRLRYQNAAVAEDPRLGRIEAALAPRFIDRAKLEALGFDCSVEPGNERAASFYRAALPRLAFVVFTLGGPEWERQVTAWQARRRQQVDGMVAGGELKGDAVERWRADIDDAPARLSRLMPIDVGRDAATLRARYPDRARYLILRGVVRLNHRSPDAPGGPSLHGHLIQVFPSILNVPRDLRAPLEALREPPRREHAPGGVMLDYASRYEVRVTVGRSLQPWVTEVRPVTPPAK